jgi:hypothetical protein
VRPRNLYGQGGMVEANGRYHPIGLPLRGRSISGDLRRIMSTYRCCKIAESART